MVKDAYDLTLPIYY